jgi:hypothetical protein
MIMTLSFRKISRQQNVTMWLNTQISTNLFAKFSCPTYNWDAEMREGVDVEGGRGRGGGRGWGGGGGVM